MKKKFVLLFILFFSSSLFSQNLNLDSLMQARNEYYFSFEVSDLKQLESLSNLISIDKVDGNVVVAYANSKQYDAFLKTGYRPNLLVPPSMQRRPKMMNSEKACNAWDVYPTYNDYELMMSNFATTHPDKCDIDTLGILNSGRKILVAHLNNGIVDGKPKFLYSSTIHGDEVTGYVLMLRLIDFLLNSNDFEAQYLLNNLDIYICPNANPDGTYYYGDSTIWGARRYNAQGIDMNRNYPDFDDGAHPDWNDYASETLWFMQLAQDNHFTMSANFHGGAEVLNYPWDTQWKRHADDAWWQLVCHEYADTVHVNSSANYMTYLNNGVTNGYDWYSISGSRQDYMNYYASCREVTIEISNDKNPDASELPTFWNANFKSFLAYMHQALYGLHGIVVDSLTQTPLRAQVFIENHDDDNSQVFSDSITGAYHRPVKAGTYVFTFSAANHYSKSFTMTLSDFQKTTLNVQLSDSVVDRIDDCQNKRIANLYPNPVSGLLNIDVELNNIDVFVCNATGEIVMQQKISKGLNQIDVSKLPRGIYFVRLQHETDTTTEKLILN